VQRPEITPDLLAYAKGFIDMKQWEYEAPDNPIRNYGSVTTIVLHREGQFQTELVISHPNSPEWPGEHRHPNVDSIEIEVYDCHGLTRNGEVVTKPDLVHHGRYLVHLLPTDLHGSKANLNGISLLSCQKWLNGVAPSSVGLDWAGVPVHAKHSDLIAEVRHGL
jgi:hypothetical protein